MRAALWFLALFGVAVAVALFAGNNQGTITLFWPPWRLDLSLNLVLLLLVAGFVFMHAVLRAMAALFDLPRQAMRWRTQQKERAMHASLLDALSHLMAGRYIRARKSAEAALAQQKILAVEGGAAAGQVHVLAHLVAAESAQALQDRASREEHLQEALARSGVQDAREGALLRAAR
ncbi:MAG: heme biosynthesis HemY N-terminal domain-containing protein, partial [Burkholderiaceae bacterium]|nr:heme biosynthesis HemY N-terminal domain-containing protein [Burkholderiaceae bacterium]